MSTSMHIHSYVSGDQTKQQEATDKDLSKRAS